MKKLYLALFSLLASINVFAHGMSEEDKAKALEASNWEYIELGATHMITGYDHLLFLFGVIFFITSFKEIVKFITAFTIGHSITLVFATLYQIQANYYLVDAVIALTVIYKAFDNLDGFKKYLNTKSPNLLWMVFGFGLIHGFGLSTRLQMLPLAEEGLVLRILSFNVGVEFGQIAALGIMLIFLSFWRKRDSFIRFSNASNVLLMLAGFFLLNMQLHGYQHSTYIDEFPFNEDEHSHIHEDWSYESGTMDNHESHSQNVNETQSSISELQKTLSEMPKMHSHGDGEPHFH
tara:strand:- start:1335 stop:2207 length:873 start_codon:yes stop_codon:yes gene_type:complete